MKSNFEAELKLVLKHEGGFVDHPNDPGGATNKGVTIATFRRYVNPTGTVSDLKALTDEQAGKVYQAQYWNKVWGDKLPSGVDYAVFDFAVNSGPNRSVKYVQRIVGSAIDGGMGPNTFARIEYYIATNNAQKLINRLCHDRLEFMKRIKGGKLWVNFGRGWQRRVDDVRAHSNELAL